MTPEEAHNLCKEIFPGEEIAITTTFQGFYSCWFIHFYRLNYAAYGYSFSDAAKRAVELMIQHGQ